MKNSRKFFIGGLTVLALVSLGSLFPKSVNAAGCGGPYPPKPARVWVKPGPGGGQVTLYWDKVNYADRYAVAYGTGSGSYQYGATNIGGSASTSYTVSGLSSGTQYFFKLAAARDCSSSPFSDEVSAWASPGGTVQTRSGEKTGSATTSWSTPSTNSNLSVWPGPGAGQVTVKWWAWGDADNYHLVYGTTPEHNQYGALNIGKSGQMTVKSLVPGKNYYFAIVSVKGNQAGNTGNTVSATAAAPVAVVETSQQNIQPKTMAVPQQVEFQDENISDPVVNNNIEDDDIDSKLYEDENNNVQGLMDESSDSEAEDYAAEDQAVADDYTVVNNESAEYEAEDANYAAENQAVTGERTGGAEEF